MLNDIDPYTEYYPASEQEDLAMMTSGEYGGIGAVITEIPGRGYSYPSPTRAAIAESRAEGRRPYCGHRCRHRAHVAQLPGEQPSER